MKRVRGMAQRTMRFLNTKWGGITALLLSIGGFLSLTLTRLTATSIWFDEAFSSYLMRFSVADITHYTSIDVHPPLYYYLLKLWTNIFGNNPVTIRLFSVILGVVVIILAYYLIKKLFNRRSASLTILLLAISPMFVRYGIEARMYMLVSVIALTATIVYTKLLRSDQLRWYILYGILISLGMWTHYFTVIIWFAHWIYRAIYLRQRGAKGKELARKFFSRNWVLAHALGIALYIPWMPIAYKQMVGLSNGFWIPSVSVNTPIDYLSQYFVQQSSGQATGWLAVLVVVTIVLTTILIYRTYSAASTKAKRNILLVAIIAIAPVFILLAFSMPPLTSVFVDRYLITATIFLTILLAVTLANTKPTRLTYATFLAVILCFISGIVNIYCHISPSTMAGKLVDEITAESDAPIIALGDFTYYEAAAHEDNIEQIYFPWINYKDNTMGSMQMLRDNKLGRGIEDMNQFTTEHPFVWVMEATDKQEVTLPDTIDTTNWRSQKTVSVTNPVTGQDNYRATLYQISK